MKLYKIAVMYIQKCRGEEGIGTGRRVSVAGTGRRRRRKRKKRKNNEWIKK